MCCFAELNSCVPHMSHKVWELKNYHSFLIPRSWRNVLWDWSTRRQGWNAHPWNGMINHLCMVASTNWTSRQYLSQRFYSNVLFYSDNKDNCTSSIENYYTQKILSTVCTARKCLPIPKRSSTFSNKVKGTLVNTLIAVTLNKSTLSAVVLPFKQQRKYRKVNENKKNKWWLSIRKASKRNKPGQAFYGASCIADQSRWPPMPADWSTDSFV